MKTLAQDMTSLREAAGRCESTAVTFGGSIGDVLPQGDVNVVCLSAVPEGATPRDDRQLAEGTSKGSRHVLLGDVAELFDVTPDAIRAQLRIDRPDVSDTPDYMVGPVFVVPQGQTAELDHPEHGNLTCPEGVYGVFYQRTAAADGREQRAKD